MDPSHPRGTDDNEEETRLDQRTATDEANEHAHSEDTSSPPRTTPPLRRGIIKQILWNQTARDLGLEGIDVVKRYGQNGEEKLVLVREGEVIAG
jgi:hypothetical protein